MRTLTGHLHQRGDVENQRDPPVAENAGACNSVDVLKVFSERLNDDVLLAEQLVDDDSDFVILDAADHDRRSRRLSADSYR